MTETRLQDARREFGELLLERNLDWPSIGVFLILVFLMAVLGGFALLGAVSSMLNPPPLGVDAVSVAVLSGLGLFLLVGIVFILRWMCTRVEFRERGVIRRRFGRLVAAMAYSQIDEFVFDVTQRQAEGVASGSAVTIVCRSAEGERFRYRGVFHDPLAASFNPREAESSAIGLCSLRDVLATEVVRRWLAADGEFHARLGRRGVITRTQFIPSVGRSKGVPIPLELIELIPGKAGSFRVHCRGNPAPLVKLRANQPNLWPFMVLLHFSRGEVED